MQNVTGVAVTTNLRASIVFGVLLACSVSLAWRVDLAATAGCGVHGLFENSQVVARHPFDQDVGLAVDFQSGFGPILGFGVMHVGPQSYTVLSPHIGLNFLPFAVEFWPRVVYAKSWLIPVTGLMRIGAEDRFHFQLHMRHGSSQATQGRLVLGFRWPIGRRVRMEAGFDPNLIDFDSMGWDFYHGGLVLGASYLVRDGLFVSGHVRNYWSDFCASVGVTWQVGAPTWLTEEGTGNGIE